MSKLPGSPLNPYAPLQVEVLGAEVLPPQPLLRPRSTKWVIFMLNAVGDSLKPKITAVIHPSNSGVGIPDGIWPSRDITPEELGTEQAPQEGEVDLASFTASIAAMNEPAWRKNNR